MAQRYVYAVRKGRKTGIYNSWDECQQQVKGYSGAEFKKFKEKEEAISYINGINSCIENVSEVEDLNLSDAEVNAYVDGSYDNRAHQYSSGVVILYNGEKILISKLGDNEELADMRNVAGEIKGAEMAMEFALEKKASTLTIYYDYEGIEKWCNGAWKTKKDGTKKYKEYYDEVSRKVNIQFVKVKAHSGNKYNEEADQLAKKVLGL